MRLPNSYGTVYKLTGKRHKPWVARKRIGKELNEETKTVRVKYQTIGYYKTRSEALAALAEYNADPYDPLYRLKTVAEVYELWAAEYLPKLKKTGAYTASYAVLEPICNVPMAEIKLDHLQTLFDQSGKNRPMLLQVKTLLGHLYRYAITHEIVPQSKKGMLAYLDAGNSNPNKLVREIFSKDEITKLWHTDTNIARITLVLIYTGMRIEEFLASSHRDIDYEKRCISIKDAKTPSGIREVPIAEKIVPVLREVKLIAYKTYLRHLTTEYNHRPHDTRHTFTTLCTEKNIDQRIIDSIIGHKQRNLTFDVYTHITLEAKKEAVELLDFC